MHCSFNSIALLNNAYHHLNALHIYADDKQCNPNALHNNAYH